MSQLNDISLVAQVVVFKNTRAFDQLVQKYQSPVRRFFLNLTCGDSELSDDLAQDTFIKAYTNIANFKNLSSFSTWLYRIAYNVFYDYIRSRKETTDLDAREVDAANSTEQVNVGDGCLPITQNAERNRTHLHHSVLYGRRKYRQDCGNNGVPGRNGQIAPFKG